MYTISHSVAFPKLFIKTFLAYQTKNCIKFVRGHNVKNNTKAIYLKRHDGNN